MQGQLLSTPADGRMVVRLMLAAAILAGAAQAAVNEYVLANAPPESVDGSKIYFQQVTRDSVLVRWPEPSYGKWRWHISGYRVQMSATRDFPHITTLTHPVTEEARAHSYLTGARGTNHCPVRTPGHVQSVRVENETACMEAATMIAKPYQPTFNSSHYPSGCLRYTNHDKSQHVFFNSAEAGNGQADTEPLCLQYVSVPRSPSSRQYVPPPGAFRASSPSLSLRCWHAEPSRGIVRSSSDVLDALPEPGHRVGAAASQHVRRARRFQLAQCECATLSRGSSQRSAGCAAFPQLSRAALVAGDGGRFRRWRPVQ